LNFDIPVANNLRLVATGSPNLYRNNAGLTYPYTTTGLFSITGSSATTDPTAYYYYFYNWEVRPESCFSERVPAVANISNNLLPAISVTPQLSGYHVQFNNSSLYVDNHFWDFNDGTTANTANPTHNYSSIGNYTVRYKATNDCGADSIAIPIAVVAGIGDIESMKQIRLFPNPVSGELYIQLNYKRNEKIKLQLLDIAGRLVKHIELPVNEGENTLSFEISEVASGVYLLQISGKEINLSERIVISN
jgi:hypothetical protein